MFLRLQKKNDSVVNNIRKQIWLQCNNLRQCYLLALEKVLIDCFFFIEKPIIVHRLHLDTIVSTSVKCLDKCHAAQRSVALSIHKKT